ncbi:MAG: hypothetical protein HY821_07425 [Acidobacteria bacterium]|nr:hypothetical protein [Acidobacteriota bacterium]
MDNRIRFAASGAALFFAAAAVASAYPSGSRIPAGNAGEPGAGTPCSSCHRVTLNPSGGSATLSVPDTLSYEPGVKQTFTLRIADADSTRRFGFQLTATAGTLASPQGVTITSGGKQYINQSSATSAATIEWTPPAGSTAPITIYVAGAACKGTSNTNVYTASYTLTYQPPQPAVPAGPTLAAAEPVLNAATAKTTLAPGTIASVRGTLLTPDSLTANWADSPGEDGLPPFSLAGVTVLFNGNPTRILSVSATRVLFLVPFDAAAGSASVKLSATHGDTAETALDVADSVPALWSRTIGDKRVATAYAAGGALIALASEFTEPWLGRLAAPNSTIALLASGLPADTDPARLQVTIGTETASILGVEAAQPGLTRILVKVPDLATGEHTVKLSLDSTETPITPVLPVQR